MRDKSSGLKVLLLGIVAVSALAGCAEAPVGIAPPDLSDGHGDTLDDVETIAGLETDGAVEAGDSGASGADGDSESPLMDAETIAMDCSAFTVGETAFVADGIPFGPAEGGTNLTHRHLARSVGEDLYLEVSWRGHLPDAPKGTFDTFNFRMGMRIAGAATITQVFALADPAIEFLGMSYRSSDPNLVFGGGAGGAPMKGCLAVRHLDDGSTSVAFDFGGAFTGSNGTSATVAVTDEFAIEPLEMQPYNGECSGYDTAQYLLIQGRDSTWLRLLDTQHVETDCGDQADGKCASTGAGECDNADRWICAYCHGKTCLDAHFQPGCLPPYRGLPDAGPTEPDSGGGDSDADAAGGD